LVAGKVFTHNCDIRKTFCIDSVLKHCEADRKRRLSALPNVGPYIYMMLKFLALQGTPDVYDISRLRVKWELYHSASYANLREIWMHPVLQLNLHIKLQAVVLILTFASQDMNYSWNALLVCLFVWDVNISKYKILMKCTDSYVKGSHKQMTFSSTNCWSWEGRCGDWNVLLV
jgi:hypothetical protein